jgi:hypothetical protein
MTSAIDSIYDAIAGWSVYYDSDLPPTVHEVQGLRDYTGTPEMPVRILSNISPEGEAAGTFVALGKTQRIDWTISDLLLIRPTSLGGSLRNSAPQIQTYIVDYIDAVKADRSPTNQSWVESMTFTPGTYEYGDNVSYYGVNVILTVSEIIS